MNIFITNTKKLKYIVLSILFISCIYLFDFNYNYYKNFIKNIIIPEKTIVYKVEKIIRMAECRNKPAYINNSYMHLWTFQPYNKKFESGKIYYSSPYIDFINSIDKNFYFKNGFIFENEEKVMSEFKNNGGKFSYEELKKLDFKILKDINCENEKYLK